MFFEFPVYQEYVLMSNQHVIDKNRKVIEQKVLTAKNDVPNFIDEKVIQINEISKVKSNEVTKQTKPLKINVIEYSNSSVTILDDVQLKLINSINNQKLKKITLKTYSNSNIVSIARLENILKQLNPELRIKTIYSHETCEKSLKCDITEIKTIY